MKEKYLLVDIKKVVSNGQFIVRYAILRSEPFHNMFGLHDYAERMGYKEYSSLTIYTNE